MKKVINNFVCRVLYTTQQINEGVAKVAKQIANDYQGKQFTLLIVANGGIPFGLDLSRALEEMRVPHSYEIIFATRYNGDNNGGAEVSITKKPGLDIKGKNIIVTEDLVDEGITLNQLDPDLRDMGPASLSYAVLGTKEKHQFKGELKYKAFDEYFPEEWIFGYGMDWEKEYRGLQEILYKTDELADSAYV
jgi:hypoxanthine phosphoribosyltransferase